MAKATDSGLDPERPLDLSGVRGGGTFPEKIAEQERPYPGETHVNFALACDAAS